MSSCPLIKFSGVAYEKLVRHEKLVFAVFLCISLLQLWLTRYVPSLDGPQHLYSANVLLELIKGNELFHSFFKINDVLVGYWTGSFFLAFFKFWFPAWLAEKLFLTTYVLAMVFSFRYLVRSMNPSSGNFVSYLIFPFLFHSYLLMGYYTFSIAAIFFFLAFGYWIRHRNELTLFRMGMFALIMIGLFLSHGFVYVLFGISFVVYFGSTFLYAWIAEKDTFKWKHWLNIAWRTALSVGPSLVLWIVYIRSVLGINSAVIDASYTFGELLKFLLRIRQLVGFNHELESVAYIPLFIMMVVLVIVLLVLFVAGIKDGSKRMIDLLNKKNAWIFIFATFLGLYFFAPDHISAGSLTHRFGLFFFLAFITWLSMQKFPKTFQLITMVVILFSITYARAVHHKYYVNQNKIIADIEELADMMEANSVATYQQASSSWARKHYQLYAVSNSPIVHLQNSQCMGQFPIEWNLTELPLCYAGSKEVIAIGARYAEGVEREKMQVDYVTVFEKDTYFKDSTNIEWWSILDEYYEEVKVGSRGRAALYKRSTSR